MMEKEIRVNKGLSLALLIFAIIGVIPFVSFGLHMIILFPLINCILAFIYLLKSDKRATIIAYFVLSVLILIFSIILTSTILDLIIQLLNSDAITSTGEIDQVAYDAFLSDVSTNASNGPLMVIALYGSIVGKVVLLVLAVINNNTEKRNQQELLMRDVIEQVNY